MNFRNDTEREFIFLAATKDGDFNKQSQQRFMELLHSRALSKTVVNYALKLTVHNNRWDIAQLVFGNKKLDAETVGVVFNWADLDLRWDMVRKLYNMYATTKLKSKVLNVVFNNIASRVRRHTVSAMWKISPNDDENKDKFEEWSIVKLLCASRRISSKLKNQFKDVIVNPPGGFGSFRSEELANIARKHHNQR